MISYSKLEGRRPDDKASKDGAQWGCFARRGQEQGGHGTVRDNPPGGESMTIATDTTLATTGCIDKYLVCRGLRRMTILSDPTPRSVSPSSSAQPPCFALPSPLPCSWIHQSNREVKSNRELEYNVRMKQSRNKRKKEGIFSFLPCLIPSRQHIREVRV